MFDIEGTDGRECVFCKTGNLEIQLKEGKTYTKGECIKDYEKFLRMIKDKKKIKDIIDKKY